MRLYNSLTREVEEVKPVDGRTVRMYSCGPTVYRYAHLGNFRTFMLGDLIRRGLRLEGQDVYYVMNITDVGHMTDEVSDTGRDRMELAEADEGLSAWEIAAKYTDAFLEDSDALNIQRADVYPKATDHIPEMIELTRKLIETGHAYGVDGNVYFDIRSFPQYGRLSGNTLEALRAGHRQDLEVDPNKRHPEDFALWKRATSNRVMKWPSPWGEGFPGWHIECSAMSMKYLGERFDIHTGGNDLKFPHHEDEIAQSEAATGHPVVGIWVHGGFLQMSGKKMAKSAMNIQRVTDLAADGIDPLAFRLLCLGTRYRSEMDFSWEALEQANRRLGHLRQRLLDWSDAPTSEAAAWSEIGKELDRRFKQAIADDLDMPASLVAISDAERAGIYDGERYGLLASWDQVLGLDLERAVTTTHKVELGSQMQLTTELSIRVIRAAETEEVTNLARERDQAREVGDFARADEIRQHLIEMGYEVIDTAEGTRIRPRP